MKTGRALDRAVRDTSLTAVENAAVVVYVLDGKAGLSPADEAAVTEPAGAALACSFVVNKLDSPGRLASGTEFSRLGADDLIPVSAAHGHGMSELVDRILAATTGGRARPPPPTRDPRRDRRPTERREVVAPEPAPRVRARDRRRDRRHDPRRARHAPRGRGTRYVLVDTAGIRRRSKVHDPLERSSVGSAIEALGRADVAVLVIDAVEGLTTQDQKLAALA